ncbi:MAG: hypothetical protein KDA41_00520, partial [Planctomycetales bacterium]|nr:hypothetical protein [Planctomycetales bacterium]
MNRARRCAVELLEPRCYLAGEGLASIAGDVASPGAAAEFLLSLVEQPDAARTGATRMVVLQVERSPLAACLLDPAAVGLRDRSSGEVFDAVFADAYFHAGESALALFELPAGQFVVEVAGERGSSGTFTLSARLPGDADGDGRVERVDLAHAMAADAQATVGLSRAAARMYGALGVNVAAIMSDVSRDAEFSGRNGALHVQAIAHNLAAPGATITLEPNGPTFMLAENSPAGAAVGVVVPQRLAGAASLSYSQNAGADAGAF